MIEEQNKCTCFVLQELNGFICRGRTEIFLSRSRSAPCGWAKPSDEDQDSDVEILKIVQDHDVDPTVSPKDTRRAKRVLVKYKSQQIKKKGCKE
ncbi:hypothetical protein LIER_20744 [Lithospermum erythrorhizon]|uniref:Uncharacterized protein n=1 Tax=Lithospermum erythrorhizon TaxID=34254 RepID=A0AAV3QQL0_LITER